MLNRITTAGLYWRCQLAGWTLAALFWSYQAYFQGRFHVGIAALHLLLDVAIGIGLTHGYRAWVKRQPPSALLVRSSAFRALGAVLLLSGAYLLAVVSKNYGMQVLFNPSYATRFAYYYEQHALTLFVTGIRLLTIWVLLYHVFQYAQREIRLTQENARLQVLAGEAQLANLRAQLNPHFLFNALHTIKALVLDDPRVARRSIDLLADLLRKSLTNSTDELITVQAELELVRDYLELETLRFEERLRCHYHLDPATHEALVPPLSIQGLVENAIKHGIGRRKQGGTLAVTVSYDQEMLIVTISNCGRLVDAAPGAGLGLLNLRERLAAHYHGQARFELVQSAAEVVTATLAMPLISRPCAS
ncbi:sensor histidine kinase [Hymenobacter negativus]|uniref:Histidine kinase n=1 Tax=Hymenobacter negativus TaxID=2795026 RepID=A0ABS3QLF2_9BACT|nr:histidine kinase [Hymenobacter negativus]MBO2012094.1 histidine kinase [Hymenobacter negativus]